MRSCRGNMVVLGSRLRGQHPLPFGRGEVTSRPDETLLVRLEFGDALLNLLPLGAPNPIHGRKPGRFNDGWLRRRLRLNAVG